MMEGNLLGSEEKNIKGRRVSAGCLDCLLWLRPDTAAYRWDVWDDSVKITVSHGQLDATFTGSWRHDSTFSGGWRPNPRGRRER